MTFKVVMRQHLMEADWEPLSKIGAQVIELPIINEADIIDNGSDADAFILGATEPFTPKVINSLSKCRVISRMGIGCDNIDLKAATDAGIPVAFIPDASTEEVSDHALTLILCFARQIIPLNQIVKVEGWGASAKSIVNIRKSIPRISEQTLGLIGLGRIGSALARKAKALGMRIIVFDPYISDATLKQSGIESGSLDKIFAESDFISLHSPLTKETKHLLDLQKFKKMKPTSYVINTSRGGLINENDLVEALNQGYIAGAGLDVTDPEPPLKDNPLLKMSNTIITPHVAYYSQGSTKELGRRAIEAVVSALSGRWPSPIANPEVKNHANRRIS